MAWGMLRCPQRPKWDHQCPRLRQCPQRGDRLPDQCPWPPPPPQATPMAHMDSIMRMVSPRCDPRRPRQRWPWRTPTLGPCTRDQSQLRHHRPWPIPPRRPWPAWFIPNPRTIPLRLRSIRRLRPGPLPWRRHLGQCRNHIRRLLWPLPSPSPPLPPPLLVLSLSCNSCRRCHRSRSIMHHRWRSVRPHPMCLPTIRACPGPPPCSRPRALRDSRAKCRI